jgi:hypothetical protein
MPKVSVICASTLVLILVACSKSEHVVIRADSNQLGAGATITMDGKKGHFVMPPNAAFPQGIDENVVEKQMVNGVTGGILTVTTEHYMDLSFIVAVGTYTCQTCSYMKLPISWHRIINPQ